MSKLKPFTCFIIIVGILSSSFVTAEFERTSNVTIQLEPYLDGIKCLSVIGPNFCPLTELLFLGKLESYGGTYNRTAPVNPVITRFDAYQDVDYLCDEVTISDFDLIFLPGEYHDMNNSLSYYPTVIPLIIDAYNGGLVIAVMNYGSLILATADIITGKNITGPPGIQSVIEAAGGNFLNYAFGIQTDFPFVTCVGYDEPYLIYAAAAALGIDIPIPVPTKWSYPPSSTAAIHIPSLIFIMSVSLFAILFKKKRR